jgi:hypothetical protein
MDATLRAIAARSCTGSRVAITYASPEMLPGGAVVGGLLRAAARGVGEPVRGLVTQAEVAARLSAAGFAVCSDEATLAWAARYWAPREAARVRSRERLVVAARG